MLYEINKIYVSGRYGATIPLKNFYRRYDGLNIVDSTAERKTSCSLLVSVITFFGFDIGKLVGDNGALRRL